MCNSNWAIAANILTFQMRLWLNITWTMMTNFQQHKLLFIFIIIFLILSTNCSCSLFVFMMLWYWNKKWNSLINYGLSVWPVGLCKHKYRFYLVRMFSCRLDERFLTKHIYTFRFVLFFCIIFFSLCQTSFGFS